MTSSRSATATDASRRATGACRGRATTRSTNVLSKEHRERARHMASEVLAPKAPQRRKSRDVVFLDQNVVCELAKHRLGRPSAFGSGSERLLDALDAAVVKRQVAVCVESIYHRIESEPLDGEPDNGALFEEA